MRGEWIEIYAFFIHFPIPRRLSPCGESGLKSLYNLNPIVSVGSLPMRGEWIEILLSMGRVGNSMGSLPMRGEWIEI